MRRFIAAVWIFSVAQITQVAAEPDAFPSRDVQIIVGGGAGGTLDVIVRAMRPAFQEEFGHKLVVINRPGAFGMIAAHTAMEAEPDGHTISTITPGALDAMEQHQNPGYDKARLRFIAGLVTFPLVIVVSGGSSTHTIGDLIAASPKNWGTSNTIGELGGQAFLDAAGIEPRPQRIYYRGKEPQMLLDVMRGEIPFALVTAPAALSQLSNGTLRAIAVVAEKRSRIFPDTPTLAEALTKAHRPVHKKIREPTLGIAGPVQTPSTRIDRLARGFQKLLERQDIQDRLKSMPAETTDWAGWEKD